MFAVTLATGIFIALQWWEIRTSSVDTHELAKAAKSQSETTKLIAEQAKTQSDNTAQIATSTAEQVKQLAANVKEAHAATEHAESTFQRSERPWINAESMEAIAFDPPGDRNQSLSMKVRVVIKNTGKSVATDGEMMVWPAPNSTTILVKGWRKPCEMIENLKFASALSRQRGIGDTWPHGFVLTPGESVPEEITFGSSEITTANYQGFWVLGCATYNDQFGKQHHTNFCFQIAGPSAVAGIPAFKVCNGFQEAN